MGLSEQISCLSDDVMSCLLDKTFYHPITLHSEIPGMKTSACGLGGNMAYL